MSAKMKHLLRGGVVSILFFGLGFAPAFSRGFSWETPEAGRPVQRSSKNYFSWGSLDLIISGRLILSYEHIFKIADRSIGFHFQFNTRQNSIIKGMLTTAIRSDGPTLDMLEYPSGTEFYLHYYGKRKAGESGSFFRTGLSFLKIPKESAGAVYMPLGIGVRAVYSKNVHILLTFATMKIKLSGNPKYNIVLIDPFAVMVGFNF